MINHLIISGLLNFANLKINMLYIIDAIIHVIAEMKYSAISYPNL